MFVRTNKYARVIHDRLLEIAIAEFAARGLEGASTRGIAAAAGTAMSSITYHFGGKEGLYLAAADYIAGQIGHHIQPAIDDEGVPPDTTPDAARARIHAILGRFIEIMAGEQSAPYSLFIVREQINPTEAFERIYGGLMGRILDTLVELVERVTGARDGVTARAAVITLLGQVVVLRASRATVLKLMRLRQLDAASAAVLRRRIVANIDAILDRMIAERQDHA